MLNSSAVMRDRVASVLAHVCMALILGSFVLIVSHMILKSGSGWSPQFLTGLPENAGRAGGILPILVSTLLILGVCLAVSIPIGVGTALLLSEFKSGSGTLTLLVRRSLDILAGIPSIVFGLFGNAFFCKTLGFGFSILSGGLTLACMVLPLLVRTCEESLRLAPDEYRRAGAALALSKWTMIRRFLLPAALPGLAVGLVLGIGRALAETAALLFTSGYVDRMPESLLDSGRALSVHIFDLSMNVPGGDANASKSAVTLLILILLVNGLAITMSRIWMKRGSQFV